jgi:RHS repeat-associated protein
MAEQRQHTYGTPYKFNGKESDEETELYYYGARYYDPKLSIFASIDRFTEKFPDQSPYTYAANNPIKFIDVNGDSIIIGNVNYTPRMETSSNYDDFTNATISALNKLVSDPNTTSISTPNVSGNAILDFVGENALGNITIQQGSLYGFHHITSEDGSTINFSEDIGIFLQGDNTLSGNPGIMSPVVILGHEFGHAWLAHADPILNLAFENSPNPDFHEHVWLTPFVQNISRSFGEEIPKTLRAADPSKEEMLKRFGKRNDYFIKK